MKLYIGNLSYSVDEEILRTSFDPFGEVVSVKIITDKFTGKSRGFAFVEMASDEEGNAAIAEMNEKEVGGRQLIVNQARPQESRPPRRNNRY